MDEPLAVRPSPPTRAPTLAPPPHRWVLALFAVTLGMWVGLLASAQVLLPSQIEAIAPGQKVWAMGVVTTVGAVAAALSGPFVGALSDRTTWRFGKRRSWAVGGSGLCAVALLLLPWQTSLVGVGLCWVLVHGGVGGISAALFAVVSDRVPVDRRGTVFAVVGFAQPVGLVLGTLLVSGVSVRVGYLLVGALVVVLAVPYALIGRDVPVRTSPARGWAPHLASLGPDFGWACAGRFAAQFATSLATVYLLYFLRDEIKVGDPAQGVAVLSLMFTAGIVVVGLLVGRASDRVGRRKAFVIFAAMLMAAGLTAMGLVSTWAVAVVAAAALGGGYGAYLAVDQALATQLLRGDDDRGKNLGLMNMAGSSAVAIAPVVAAGSVHIGGYAALFLLAAVVAVLGGLLVQPIKSVP
ncbi:MFS transporter [Actinomadura spongiicola]|uniref:MFS transporter n=1 Tax=Actinomadura spongiicola TaxID=2303421 RepID=A0A372GLN9_9ACTN|nr:MFS transporter [Actinomadura spongiicola]